MPPSFCMFHSPPPIVFVSLHHPVISVYITSFTKHLTVYTTTSLLYLIIFLVEASWNMMAHGDAREGKWRGNWRMEWVASTLHTTSEHGVSSITTTDAHTSAASSWLSWRPCRFKWTRPFRRNMKSGFCSCAITFQLTSTHIARLCNETSRHLLRDFRLPPWSSWELRSSGLLHSEWR